MPGCAWEHKLGLFYLLFGSNIVHHRELLHIRRENSIKILETSPKFYDLHLQIQLHGSFDPPVPDQDNLLLNREDKNMGPIVPILDDQSMAVSEKSIVGRVVEKMEFEAVKIPERQNSLPVEALDRFPINLECSPLNSSIQKLLLQHGKKVKKKVN